MAYQQKWRDRSAEILAIAKKVAADNPDAWNEVKVHGQKSRRFINLVSMALIAAGIPGGVNLKRGGPDESLDALAFPNDSGASDASGKYRGVEIIDIVVNAEREDAFLDWTDVTQKTLDAGVPGGWKAGSLSQSAPPQSRPSSQPLPGRAEMMDEGQRLHAFYAAPEGLQRPQGLSKDGAPDWEGVGAWLFDVYLVARLAGKSREEARAAYESAIRNTDEWKSKHR